MRRRPSIAGLIALLTLASGCGNQATPTYPSQTAAASAGGLDASGSGSSGTFTLQVSKNGTGTGTVASSPSGISCGTTCSRSFSGGTTVTLTAVAASGSIFAGWAAPAAAQALAPCRSTTTPPSTPPSILPMRRRLLRPERSRSRWPRSGTGEPATSRARQQVSTVARRVRRTSRRVPRSPCSPLPRQDTSASSSS